MRRVRALWLLVFAVASTGAIATYLRCPGCIPRDRVNQTCEWTGDRKFPLEAQNAEHQKHLVADAQLAEELGIRYADAQFRLRFGVEHHGGLLDHGRVRGECLSRMFHAIENNHGVTSEQIEVARGHRSRLFDIAVVLLFVPLYALGTTIACRWLCHRFSANERYAGLVATGLASTAAAFLGTQCFRLWGGVWEVIRVGNGHMTSIRAASASGWTKQYGGADFVGAMLLFWLIALICYRNVSDHEHAPDLDGPRGIILPRGHTSSGRTRPT